VAIHPLLQLHLAQQIVDGDGERLFDLAVDGDLPGPHLQGLGGRGDALGGAELIEIVEGDVVALRRHRPPGLGEFGVESAG
jgi:hypothetical protein